MAGKRYRKEEVDLIVELKNSGKGWEEISKECLEKFSTVRTPRVLKIIYDRSKTVQTTDDTPLPDKVTKLPKKKKEEVSEEVVREPVAE